VSARSKPTAAHTGRLRLGLCCAFREEPIKFRNTTAAATGRLTRPAALARLSELCLANADALLAALRFCADHGIGCFRVNSQILPLKTHPRHGYEVRPAARGYDRRTLPRMRHVRPCPRLADPVSTRTSLSC
jgi:UV DNA damage repair endonuclease